MKIVIAPDSYKESLSALEVATAIEQGFREIFPSAVYVKLPVADGGEGTVEAMVAATHGRIVHVPVSGPLGERVEGFYGVSGDEQSAFIEMAAASGLELVAPAQRNPLKTTSWGTGELIRHALDAGVKHIIIGIGGSATNDGGAGMVQALGARLLDADDRPVGQGEARWRRWRESTALAWISAWPIAELKWPVMSPIRSPGKRAHRRYLARRKGRRQR